MNESREKADRPNLYIIAGPNGSGKTTFARKFLPKYVKCLEFVNADLIAGGNFKNDCLQRIGKTGSP